MTRQYFAENCFIQSGASFAFAREKLTNFLPLQDPQKGVHTTWILVYKTSPEICVASR